MIDLDEIERVANAATPGPWSAIRSLGSWSGWLVVDNERILATLSAHTDENGNDAVDAVANAAFIAAAREAVPLLVARVRELEEMLREAEWDHEGDCQWCGEFRSDGHKSNCRYVAAMGEK